MMFDHFGLTMTEIEELIGKGAKQITMDKVEIEKAAPYAGADASAVLLMAKKFIPELIDKNLENLFYGIEMPLVEVLGLMEWHGIKVDIPYIKKVLVEFEQEMGKIEKELYVLAGEEFNPNSPKQLAVILFDKLKLPVIRKTKTGYSTDEEVLKTLSAQSKLPARILDYRELQKLKSTYLDSFLELADDKTQRLHTSFNQAVTATGRLSSSSPNLQNIPIKSEYGRMIRKCFVAEKGCSLLSADYSQIDLRALAHITGDETLKKAFFDNADVHTATAMEVFGVSGKDVTTELRRVAKTINFGIIYGMSSFSLAQQLEISPAKAKEYIDNYFRRYSRVKQWMDEIIEYARKNGYVTTVTGRVHYLPDINSKNAQIRGFSERMALNTPIQGTSADIIKIAMLDIFKFLKEVSSEAKMLLQVHDELLFEVPDSELQSLSLQLKNKMENAMKLDVPVIAELKAGLDWNTMEKLKW
jgi:DNA polymerase-1